MQVMITCALQFLQLDLCQSNTCPPLALCSLKVSFTVETEIFSKVKTPLLHWRRYIGACIAGVVSVSSHCKASMSCKTIHFSSMVPTHHLIATRCIHNFKSFEFHWS